jgi:hypothetical protein
VPADPPQAPAAGQVDELVGFDVGESEAVAVMSTWSDSWA